MALLLLLELLAEPGLGLVELEDVGERKIASVSSNSSSLLDPTLAVLLFRLVLITAGHFVHANKWDLTLDAFLTVCFHGQYLQYTVSFPFPTGMTSTSFHTVSLVLPI